MAGRRRRAGPHRHPQWVSDIDGVELCRARCQHHLARLRARARRADRRVCEHPRGRQGVGTGGREVQVARRGITFGASVLRSLCTRSCRTVSRRGSHRCEGRENPEIALGSGATSPRSGDSLGPGRSIQHTDLHFARDDTQDHTTHGGQASPADDGDADRARRRPPPHRRRANRTREGGATRSPAIDSRDALARGLPDPILSNSSRARRRRVCPSWCRFDTAGCWCRRSPSTAVRRC